MRFAISHVRFAASRCGATATPSASAATNNAGPASDNSEFSADQRQTALQLERTRRRLEKSARFVRATRQLCAELDCSHGPVGRRTVRATGAWLQLPVACRLARPQYLGANAEDIFHHYSHLLHELVAACRARLRDGAGRRDCAVSSAQR